MKDTRNKTERAIPPKSKQVCDTCKHWYKYGGRCASPGGQCGSGMYYPIYLTTQK